MIHKNRLSICQAIKMAFTSPLRSHSTLSFKRHLTILLLVAVVFAIDMCCANTSSVNRNHYHNNHLMQHHNTQKQRTKNHHFPHSDKHRYRGRDRRHSSISSSVFDLSHAYFDGMPFEEGAMPFELLSDPVKQDVGDGAR